MTGGAIPEAEGRSRIVAEARSWLGTPYQAKARVKGAGVDCLMIIIAVYQAVGLMPPDMVIPYYNPQSNLHSPVETYLDGLLEYSREVDEPKPGDVVMWQMGRCFFHAGIVIEWPTVIHAAQRSGVVLDNAVANAGLTHIDQKGKGAIPRPRKFLSYW